MNYNETLDFLFTSMPSFQRVGGDAYKPGLERIAAFCQHLGNPQRNFYTVHVAGTNGKGSTARMAEAICRAYGMRTGLYTSPHLEHVSERIAIDGQRLSDDDFVELWNQVKDFVALIDKKMDEEGAPRMSFFEVLTALSLIHI